MQLFSPKEDIILTAEEEASIADLLTAHNLIWNAQKKYFYNKMNIASRKMAKCSAKELDRLQERVLVFEEIMSDFEKIKKKRLKNAQGVSNVKAVKDLFYWIQSKDVKTNNETKLTAER